MIQKKKENGEKVATVTTEAEFHEALNRGYAVELTRELAEQIGVPMDEDADTVAVNTNTRIAAFRALCFIPDLRRPILPCLQERSPRELTLAILVGAPPRHIHFFFESS